MLAVLVQHRLEAEAALALAAEEGLAIELVMAAGIAGPAVIKAIEELLGQPITVLCDDRPGLALEALRVGLRRLVLEPGAPTAIGDRSAESRLTDIARQQGGDLRVGLPEPLYVLNPDQRRFAALGSTPWLVP